MINDILLEEQGSDPPVRLDVRTYSVRNEKKKTRKNFFPRQLMKMFSSPLVDDCIAWRHDGTAFRFLDLNKFVNTIDNSNHRDDKTKAKNFSRKINRWGFKMDLRKGPNYGMYANEYFQRDKPWLCDLMVCGKCINKKGPMPFPQAETIEEFSGTKTNNTETNISESGRRESNQLEMDVVSLLHHTSSIERKIQLTDILIQRKVESYIARWQFNNTPTTD